MASTFVAMALIASPTLPMGLASDMASDVASILLLCMFMETLCMRDRAACLRTSAWLVSNAYACGISATHSKTHVIMMTGDAMICTV